MTQRKHSSAHDFWHPRVEGQIRHTMNRHPEWFTFKNARERKNAINSLAKRIVGEIVAGRELAAVTAGVDPSCPPREESGVARDVTPRRSEGGRGHCAPDVSRFAPLLRDEQRRALGYQTNPAPEVRYTGRLLCSFGWFGYCETSTTCYRDGLCQQTRSALRGEPCVN